jgi:conjugative relaxase-like TrwC/TraI family protein
VLIVRPIGPNVGRYYLQGPGPGRWAGGGTHELGVSGPPIASTLAQVLRGVHPVDGSQLGRAHPWRRAGWDLVFAAPKSVSLMAALASVDDGEAIRAAHVQAVTETMAWMADQACWSRRDAGRVAARDLVWASFEHSRSAAGDPHLHTHVVLANVVRAPDGQWSALSSSDLWRTRRSLGALYDLGLRHQLGVAGLRFAWALEPDRPADISGVPRAAIDAASIRSKQVQSSLPADSTTTSARQRNVTRARTRRVAPEQSWTERLEAVGFGHDHVATLISRAKARQAAGLIGQADDQHVTEPSSEISGPAWHEAPTGPDEPVKPDGQTQAAYRWLTDHASAWTRSDALRALGATLERGAGPADAMQRVDDLCRGALSIGEDRWTTSEARALDERVRALASEPATRAVVTERTARIVLDQRPQLSEAQRADVRRLLFGGHGAEVVAGTPGELDFLTQAVVIDTARAAWQASGYRVRVDTSDAAAARWRAVTGVRPSPPADHRSSPSDRSSGPADPNRGTTAAPSGRWNGAADTGTRATGSADVVVIDRADRRSSRELLAILSDARRSGAKVVLVRGGSLPAQVRPRSAALVDPDRGAGPDQHAAPGALRHAPARLPASVRSSGLVVCGSLPDALEVLLDRWLAPSSRARPLLVGLGPAEVDGLNRAARSRLLALGILDPEQLEVNGQQFSQGDQVVARRSGAVPAGSLGTVVSTASQPIGLGVAWADTAAQSHTVLSSGDARHIAHGYAVGPTLAAKVNRPLLVLGDPRLAGVLRTRKGQGHDLIGVVVAPATMRRSPVPDRLQAVARDDLMPDPRGHWSPGQGDGGSPRGQWTTVDPAWLPLPELAAAHARLGQHLRASLPPDVAGDRRRLEEDRAWLVQVNARHHTDPEQWAQIERREASVTAAESALDEWRQDHRAELRRWTQLDEAMDRRGDLLGYAVASDPRAPAHQLVGPEPPDAQGSDVWWRAVRAAAIHQERWPEQGRDIPAAGDERSAGGEPDKDRPFVPAGWEAALSRRQRDRLLEDLRRHRGVDQEIDRGAGLSR